MKERKRHQKIYQKQKPTGTTCDEDIEIIEKYRKRISIIRKRILGIINRAKI